MKVSNITHTPNYDDGILLSLQFLAKEAERAKSYNLHAIIQTAIELIYAGCDINNNEQLKAHESGQETIDFLLAYMLSPQNVKKNLSVILEVLEEKNE